MWWHLALLLLVVAAAAVVCCHTTNVLIRFMYLWEFEMQRNGIQIQNSYVTVDIVIEAQHNFICNMVDLWLLRLLSKCL